MYTKKMFPLRDLILWSRRDVLKFILISSIPVILHSVLGFRFIRLPWLPVAVLGTALAFITGFKNNACYDRLWEARKVWGGITNASRSWAILVRDLITNQHAIHSQLSESELAAIKLKIIQRHIAWLTAHRYALRVPMPWEVARADKSNLEFMDRHPIPEWRMPLQEALTPHLEASELEYVMSKQNKAATLLSLQSQQIKDLAKDGHVWGLYHVQMGNLLTELYTLQGQNERIKNFPYPRQFATLNYIFIWIFIILLPFGVMGVFEELGLEMLKNFSATELARNSFSVLIAKNFIWLSIPFCAVISWVFNTMERMGVVSENPFEGTANDVPISTMAREIEIDLLEMFDVKKVPSPIALMNDVAM